MNSLMEIVCAWCGKHIGWKSGSGISHGICKKCKQAMEADI